MLNMFAPAVALMNRFKYPARFMLIGFFVILTIAILLGSLASNLLATIDLSRKELAAIALIRPLTKQVQLTQQHRGLSSGVLGGNAAMKDKLAAKQAEVDQAVEAVDAVEARIDPEWHVGEEWAAIKRDWEKLRGGGMSLSVADNLAAHGALIERILRYQSQVADAGVLTGDPDLDTFYLIETMVNRLPEMLERLGKVRAKGTGTLAKKDLGLQDRTEFSVHLVVLRRALERLSIDLGKAGKVRPQLAGKLSAFVGEITPATEEVMRMVNDDILSASFALQPEIYFDKATAAINIGYGQMFDTLMPTLETQIQARIAHLQTVLAWQCGLAAGIALLLAYLSVGVYLSVMAALRRLIEVTHAMAAGDLTVKVKLESRDELTLVADSLDQMCRSFNALLRKVQETAGNVSSAATELSSSSGRVSDSSKEQCSAAMSMAAAVEELTVGIDNISEHANMAEQTSAQSGDISVESAKIVRDTVSEMQQIATMVNQSATIIEELGKNTGRISAIIGAIREIADQTNLLALNAAIEAARAGEQGRGFAVVADEVRKLAERTSQQTQEISGMIQAINTGTENAVVAMKGGVERVAEGVALSQQAGTSIAKVREGADRVVAVVGEISVALREQSIASNDIAQNVERIAQMSEANSAAVSSVAGTAQQLERMAGGLIDEVRRFRVN